MGILLREWKRKWYSSPAQVGGRCLRVGILKRERENKRWKNQEKINLPLKCRPEEKKKKGKLLSFSLDCHF